MILLCNNYDNQQESLEMKNKNNNNKVNELLILDKD